MWLRSETHRVCRDGGRHGFKLLADAQRKAIDALGFGYADENEMLDGIPRVVRVCLGDKAHCNSLYEKQVRRR